ncbi:MAG: hypothetical protein GF383_02860 [Candidatus Lokiarchaeota archaeon]|nr:hypothetical protein [Candidatus Lokiarchaeota archaeon]MBD3338455.1 hypothetical protein [Candidatus Lokiarchaeota archaeon]
MMHSDRPTSQNHHPATDKVYLGCLYEIKVFVAVEKRLGVKLRKREFQVDLSDLSVRTKAKVKKLLKVRQMVEHDGILRFLADEVEISLDEFRSLVRIYKRKNPALKLKDFF